MIIIQACGLYPDSSVGRFETNRLRVWREAGESLLENHEGVGSSPLGGNRAATKYKQMVGRFVT